MYFSTLQDMLTGSHCCFDIRGGLMGWHGGNADWDKKCCTNEVDILTFLLGINFKIFLFISRPDR